VVIPDLDEQEGERHGRRRAIHAPAWIWLRFRSQLHWLVSGKSGARV